MFSNVGSSGLMQKVDEQVLTPAGYVPGVGVITGTFRAVEGLTEATTYTAASGAALVGKMVGTRRVRAYSSKALPGLFHKVGVGVKNIVRGGAEIVGAGPFLKMRDQNKALAREISILQSMNAQLKTEKETLISNLTLAEARLNELNEKLSDVQAVKAQDEQSLVKQAETVKALTAELDTCKAEKNSLLAELVKKESALTVAQEALVKIPKK